MRGSTHTQLRAHWLTEYEARIAAARPELTGKIDWATAIYLFNQGKSVREAVNQFLANH